jgi:hypothetical protein
MSDERDTLVDDGHDRWADDADGLFVDDGTDGATPPRASAATTAFPPLTDRIRRRSDALVRSLRDDPGRAAEAGLSVLAVGLATWLVLATLHPQELLRSTTPTGGDMGAHVWGPRYLLDNLLPQGRLSGWTPDWYDGFPAYQFYMVVPSLMIVALHVGLAWYLAVPVLLAAAAAVVLAWSRERLYPYRYLVLGAAAGLSVLSAPVPYNQSFKIITGLGLLGLPLACWAFAKLADLPFPIPPLMSAAGVLFAYNREPLYNNTGNIIGGNFQSTMAGEFAFSISLTFAVLYLGVAARGLRTGRHRALAAALFALTGLCHLIPAFFVLGCTAALFVLHPDKARLKWLATMVPVAGLLTAFWVVPFALRAQYVNDMGWEKLPLPGAEMSDAGKALAGNQSSVWYYLVPPSLRWLMVAAAFGVVISMVRRYRIGLVLALAWMGVWVAFAFLPQARLWNARLLPFMYLSIALLSAIGLGEFIRVIAAAFNGRPERPMRFMSVGLGAISVLGALLYTVLPLDTVDLKTPWGTALIKQRQVTDGTATKSERYWWMFHTTDHNPVAGWSRWNYSGLQAKVAQPAGCDAKGSTTPCTTGGWPEYRDFIATMAGLGLDPDHGCGRAFWEYDGDRLNGYGTPMAPMLLPYWTDGCIGSQEGLYFESSTTVPYHFLMQAELSAKPSNPQRELPYPTFDINAGVRHLQLLGVKYYVAASTTAVQAASTHPDLTEVAVSGPWHVYEVADAPMVEALQYQPVVAEGLGNGQHDWLPTATAWFLDQDQLDVPLTRSGPAEWKRVKVSSIPEESRRLIRFLREQLGARGPMDRVPELPRTKLPRITVTNIDHDRSSISFDVSKPGVPVLVKASYFPNWQASGAEGPYRVSPNLMVVIPTDTHVTLTYGRTPIDLLGAGLSLVGLVGLVILARRRPVAVPVEAPGRISTWIDNVIAVRPAEPAEPVDGLTAGPVFAPDDGAAFAPVVGARSDDARFGGVDGLGRVDGPDHVDGPDGWDRVDGAGQSEGGDPVDDAGHVTDHGDGPATPADGAPATDPEPDGAAPEPTA